jgi:hypothetical protein
MTNQKHFQIPVTKFGTKPPQFVGNLNVTYDPDTGNIILVTWGEWEGGFKTAIHDLLQAVAPDFWDEIVAAKDAQMEAALEPSEKIEDEQDN